MSQQNKFFLYCLLCLLTTFILTGWVEQAQSQEKYPSKPIDIIVPYGVGGSTDLGARTVASFLTEKWGIRVNVINKPGGNCLPAVLEVYKSRPDGYTILADGQGASSLMGIVIRDLPIKIMDRTFIAITARTPGCLIVPADSPYKSLDDAIADVRKDPGNFTWASLGGVGGTDNEMRKFFKAIDVDVLKTRPVMAKGGGAAAALAAGGHVKIANVAVASALAYVQGGTARALVVAWKERDPALPSVPSMTELGYPNLSATFWIGFSGPPKMSSYIVDIWNNTLEEMMKDQDYLSKMQKLGVRPLYLNASEMRQRVKDDIKEAEDLWLGK
jgi:tripartite-type tricarboxylate transporter receptor subunit TctC